MVRSGRRMKAPVAIREEAYELAMLQAAERETDGDPEGAGVIRDLADAIRKITLSEKT